MANSLIRKLCNAMVDPFCLQNRTVNNTEGSTNVTHLFCMFCLFMHSTVLKYFLMGLSYFRTSFFPSTYVFYSNFHGYTITV